MTIRKRNICLQILAQLHGGTDEEKTERLQYYLHSLLVTGLKRFDQSVDFVRQETGCACSRTEVVEKRPLRKSDLGPKHCSRAKAGTCGIVAFLKERKTEWESILKKLNSLPAEQKSAEVQASERFLETVARNPGWATEEDPCLQVGDLLIALESAGGPFVYTLNGVESQHFCRALGQTLLVRPVDPRKPEVVCPKEDLQWPTFGKQVASTSQEDVPGNEAS